MKEHNKKRAELKKIVEAAAERDAEYVREERKKLDEQIALARKNHEDVMYG